MKTPNLDKAYKKLSELTTNSIKNRIKSGPTKAYATGDMYRSVTSTVKPIETGDEITTSLNYYWEFVNDGTSAIEGRNFIEAGLKDVDQEIDDLIGDAAVEDIAAEIDLILNN